MNWLKAFFGNKYLILIFRFILAVVFLTSAFGKLVNIQRYSVDVVYEFGMLPFFMARPFGLAMPFIELLCGLGMLFGVLLRLSALGISLMSLSFLIAKTIVLSQGRSIECGCFGAIIDTMVSTTIYMDLPLMFMALVILFATAPALQWAKISNRLP